VAACVTVRELCSGLMALNTKANGSSTKHSDKVFSTIPTEILTKVLGSITKPMGMEFTRILKVLGMKASGRTINNTDMVLRNGQRVLCLKPIC